MVIGTLTMSSDGNIKDMNANYSSNPAKFKDKIKSEKTKS